MSRGGPVKRRGRRFGIRARLSLLLGTSVLLTVGLAWFLTGRAVLEPFARDMVRAHVEQVIFLAQEIENGAEPSRLSARLGLEIRVLPRPPRYIRRSLRGHGPCRAHEIRRRRVVACRGPRGGIAVELDAALAPRGPLDDRPGRWLLVRRRIDPEAPKRRVFLILVAVGIVVLIASTAIATIVTRPIRASVQAMERMASGELTHRLPESGTAEVREVANAFNRMADRISALLEAERGLMAGISHELRTPLARLRLELELLKDQNVPEKRVAAMEADVEDIDRLIGEVLESSRLSIGERSLHLDSVRLREVVEEALSQEPLPHHEVRLEGESRPVAGDRKRLVRVVRNLLENAGKYAPKETEVSVRVGEHTIEVADRGPGVPDAELQRLFEPFYRGERGRRAAATGFGLGLMIAKQVVELHGGQIEAENRPGGGLVVRLTLP